MEALRLEPGTVLAGKYRLEEPLGEGGMGTIYRAEHLVLRAPVAVKVVDREMAEGDVGLARFIREAQAAASLRSPHVVQILDYGMEGDIPFMVMELLEGETLAARLDRVTRLSPAEAFKILSHVGRAIGKAHEAGIIHRDLKPDNVFLVHNEGDEIAKVLDFGVAKIGSQVISGTATRTGSLLGTPYYMSPEQAQGNKEIDYRSDLWALGVIAFECLIGRRPFVSDGLGDLVIQICIRDIVVPSHLAQVPPGFDEWFLRAVAREPEDRFQSARALIDALADALGIVREQGPDSLQREEGSPESLRRPLTPYAPEVARQLTPYAPEVARASAEFPQRPSEIRPSFSDRTLEDLRPPEFRAVAPGTPRHAVADTLPAPTSLGKSAIILGLASMVFGSALVFGLNEAGVRLPDVAALLGVQKTGSRSSGKKSTQGAERSLAKQKGTSSSSAVAAKGGEVQRKAPLPKTTKPAAPVSLDAIPKAPSLTNPAPLPETDILPPEILDVRPESPGSATERPVGGVEMAPPGATGEMPESASPKAPSGSNAPPAPGAGSDAPPSPSTPSER